MQRDKCAVRSVTTTGQSSNAPAPLENSHPGPHSHRGLLILFGRRRLKHGTKHLPNLAAQLGQKKMTLNDKGVVGYVLSCRISGKCAQVCADRSSLQRKNMEEETEKHFF